MVKHDDRLRARGYGTRCDARRECSWTRFTARNRVVGEHLGRRYLGDKLVLLAEHDAAVGERVQGCEIVRREHDGLARVAESTISSTSHSWVRGSRAAVGSSKMRTSGFITSRTADRDPLLLSADSWYRARDRAMASIESSARMLCDPTLDFSPVQAHVQRSERDLVAHGR